MAKELIIPNDWNGEDWLCVKIQWPNSVLWRGILRGLIYSMSRGRTWDSNTGVIIDAQTVGREIDRRNQPFIRCDGRVIDSSADNDLLSLFADCDDDCSGCSDCEENNMSGCCISDLRVQGGMLQMLRCGKWEDVGIMGSAGEQPTDDGTVIEPETPEQQGQFACMKASTVVEIIWRVANAAFDRWDDFPNPIESIENSAGIQLDTTEAMIMIAAMFEADTVNKDMADIVKNNPKAQVICELQNKLDGATSAVTSEDWKAIFGLADKLSSDFLEGGFLESLINSVNKGRFDRACRAAVSQPVFDCSCPGEADEHITIPVGHDWAHLYDFRLDDYGFVGSPYEVGVGFAVRDMVRFDSLAGVGKQVEISGGTINYVHINATWPSSTTYGFAHVVACGPESLELGAWANMPTIRTPVAIGLNIAFQSTYLFGQATQDPTSGDSVFTRLMISGTGPDPYPSDAQYGG